MIKFDREFLENLEDYKIEMEIAWIDDALRFTFSGNDHEDVRWRSCKTLREDQAKLMKKMSANLIFGDSVDALIEHIEQGFRKYF